MIVDLSQDEARIVINALVPYMREEHAQHSFEDVLIATTLYCRLMIHEEVRESIRAYVAPNVSRRQKDES